MTRVPAVLRSRLRTVAAASLLCAGLLGGLSAAAAPASYTGAGSVGPVTMPPPGGSAVFVATGSYNITGLGTWSLLSSFVFNTGTGTGTGGFEFTQGGNSFSGTIATVATPIASGAGFEIDYLVTGGTGLYAGATGAGDGVIRIVSDLAGAPPYAYIEGGILDVTAVPEPATALLMLGGVAALVGRRLRQAQAAGPAG